MNTELHHLKLNFHELLINLVIRIDTISDDILLQSREEAVNRILFLAEDLEVLSEAVQLLNHHDTLMDLEELNEKMTQLNEALAEQNPLKLSDALLFELKPLLLHWSEVIKDA